MHELINQCEISKKIVQDLFDGVESDLKKEVKINSKEELFIYFINLVFRRNLFIFYCRN